MALHEADHETLVRAPAQEIFAVLTDYERLPEWQRSVERCVVLSVQPDGLASEVRYEADLLVRRVTYTLRHAYQRPHRILSEYVTGDFRRFDGDWTLDDAGDGRTAARLWLRIDPGVPIPGRIVRMLHERVLRAAVDDLRERVEGG